MTKDEWIFKRCSLAQRFELKTEITVAMHTRHSATAGVMTIGDDNIMTTTPDASDGSQCLTVSNVQPKSKLYGCIFNKSSRTKNFSLLFW